MVCNVHVVEEHELTMAFTTDDHAGAFVLHKLRHGSTSPKRYVLIDPVDVFSMILCHFSHGKLIQ